MDGNLAVSWQQLQDIHQRETLSACINIRSVKYLEWLKTR